MDDEAYDWVDDDSMGAEETLRRFGELETERSTWASSPAVEITYRWDSN